MKRAMILFLLTTIKLVAQNNEPQPGDKGYIPNEHIVMDIIRYPENYTLSEVDRIYRLNVSILEDSLDYIDNIKNAAFFVLMDKGLVENSTIETRIFYVNQQMGLQHNLPNISNFYDLLYSVRDVVTKEELKKKSEIFYDKNMLYIKELLLSESELILKEKKLMVQQNNFQRLLSLK